MDLLTRGGPPGGPGPVADDQMRAQLESTMGMIRDAGQKIEEIAQTFPAAQAEIQQLRQILRRLVIKAGQMGPTQNASADALPMGGAG